MKLVTNHKSTTDKESRSDQYYKRIYEKLSAGKKISWNWGASCFMYWLLYRKMYLVWFFCFIYVSAIFSIEIEIGVSLTLGLPLALVFGLFGNWFYVQDIHKKIDRGYHLCRSKNIDTRSPWLLFCTDRSSRYSDLFPLIFGLATLLSILNTIVSDRRELKKVILRAVNPSST